MGRAKIKKKSTFIDMTAMSDVTAAYFFYVDIYIRKKGAGTSNNSSLSFRN